MKDNLLSGRLFKVTSSDTQNELITFITDVVKQQISSEVINIPFISVQADERMSVIFRFENNESEEIEEKFVGFVPRAKQLDY